MTWDWKRFNKLWVAVVAFGTLFVMKRYDINIPGWDSAVLELILSALGAYGVYQVKNSQ